MSQPAKRGLLVIEGSPSVTSQDIGRQRGLLQLIERACGRYDIKRFTDPSDDPVPHLLNKLKEAAARCDPEAVIFSGQPALRKYLAPMRLFQPRLPFLHAADGKETRDPNGANSMIDLMILFPPAPPGYGQGSPHDAARVKLFESRGFDLQKEIGRIREARQEARVPDVIRVLSRGPASPRLDFPVPQWKARGIKDDPRALNRVLPMNSHRYTLILDSACAITRSDFERLMDYAENYPDAAAVCPYEKTSKASKGDAFEPAEAAAWAIKYSGVFGILRRLPRHCVLLKNSVIGKVGLLDPRFGSLRYSLIDYGLRLRHAGFKLVQAEEVLVCLRPEKEIPRDRRSLDLALLDEKWCRRPFPFFSGGGRPSLDRRETDGNKSA